MNRLQVEILGKRWHLKAPEDPGDVINAVREIKERSADVLSGTGVNLSREDVFLLVSLNLAKELAALKEDKQTGLFSGDTLSDESR